MYHDVNLSMKFSLQCTHHPSFLFSVWSVNIYIYTQKKKKKKRLSFRRDIFTLVLCLGDDLARKWWLHWTKLHCCHFFFPQCSDSTIEMIEMHRLEVELARITAAKNKNKVGRHKDTVSVTRILCLPVSKIQNVYFRQATQPSSNTNSCNPFISHQ